MKKVDSKFKGKLKAFFKNIFHLVIFGTKSKGEYKKMYVDCGYKKSDMVNKS